MFLFWLGILIYDYLPVMLSDGDWVKSTVVEGIGDNLS